MAGTHDRYQRSTQEQRRVDEQRRAVQILLQDAIAIETIKECMLSPNVFVDGSFARAVCANVQKRDKREDRFYMVTLDRAINETLAMPVDA
jgi:hypothetical protein